MVYGAPGVLHAHINLVYKENQLIISALVYEIYEDGIT